VSGARPARPDEAILGVAPRLAFEPATMEEAAEAMRACARDRLRVAFVGGATDLGLGAVPRGLDAVIHTRSLSRVVEHAPADQIVQVEAGVTIAALQAHLRPHGQRLALDPPLPERATAGGVLCANAFGPLRTSRGAVRDLVIGASLVRADGVAAKGGGKVVKNVAGFDVPRVLVGSLGTLALVTSVTFRLHPLPETESTVRIAGLAPADLRALLRAMLEAQVEPAAAAALAAGGKLELAVRFEGFGPGVAQQRERLLSLASRASLQPEPLDGAGARALWDRHGAARALGPFRARLSAPPAALEQAAAALARLLAELPGGAGVWYPTLGLGFAAGAPSSDGAVAAAASEARAALSRLGGALVLCEAPAGVRGRLDAWGPEPSAIAVMRRLKAQLDPESRLAPGRQVGGI